VDYAIPPIHPPEPTAGDVVRFSAFVKPYTKGYIGKRTDIDRPLEMDYQLRNPASVALAGAKGKE